jgi:hypothetical protein
MTGWKNWALLVTGAGMVVLGAAFYTNGAPDTTELASAEAFPAPDPTLPVIKVWKSPACGCCGAWVDHLRQAGFAVEVENVEDLTKVKSEQGVAAHLQSCHTAHVAGYALEGHVPVEDILRLLDQRPEVAGLAVPGMPAGSPGMEMGDMKDRYDVLTFDRSGRTTVWATHW